MMMVKKIMTDHTPVTRAFLIKTAISMIGLIAAMLLLTFRVGGMFTNYTELSKIPVSDIKKAVKYSVYDKPARKDMYRLYMNEKDLKDANQDAEIKSLKEWRLDMKGDIKDIKHSIQEINKKLQ